MLNKAPRLSSTRMFVRLYRLLLNHCIYVHLSVTKPTCPAFSAWLNTGSIRSLKVAGIAIMLCSMALPSKLCAALHGQSNVDSMCDCYPCRSLDLSVLVEMLSGVQWPWYRSQKVWQCQLKVNIMSNIKVMLTKDAPLSSKQIEYFISVHWRVVSIYWALMWWVIHHSICSTKCSSSCWSL